MLQDFDKGLRPDIVVVGKTKRTTTIIDIVVYLDWKVRDKADRNILKYQDLTIEIQKLINTKAKVIPVIVESLGKTSMNIQIHLREIPGKHNSTSLIKSAIAGNSNILHHALDL